MEEDEGSYQPNCQTSLVFVLKLCLYIGVAALAPWFRLRLPSCGPGFKSQALHLCFFQFVLLKLYRVNNENKQKEAGIGPFFFKKLCLYWISKTHQLTSSTLELHRLRKCKFWCGILMYSGQARPNVHLTLRRNVLVLCSFIWTFSASKHTTKFIKPPGGYGPKRFTVLSPGLYGRRRGFFLSQNIPHFFISPAYKQAHRTTERDMHIKIQSIVRQQRHRADDWRQRERE